MPAVCPLTFDAQEHLYRLNGVAVPSVTQVLRQTGYVRFDGVPEHVLERARNRGQRVHQALHFLFEDDLDESSIDDEVRGYLVSAQRWYEKHVERVLRAEFKVWSVRHYCAGTVDILAVHRNGYVFIGDFKTGQPEDVSADLQTAAYLGFALEMGGADCELGDELRSHGAVVVRRSIRLFKDGREARETPYSDALDYGRFLNALSVVHDQQKRPTPLQAWDDER